MNSANVSNVDKVVAAVKARGERFSNIEALLFDTEMPLAELRKAVGVAWRTRRIHVRTSSALGTVYWA